MRKLNKKLIKQLALGEIAVENTGILEDLREVLKAAFPQDGYKPEGGSKYYKSAWSAVNETTLPSVPIADFFINESTELQWNQPVEVRDSEDEEWRLREYVFGCLAPSPDAAYPYLVFDKTTNAPNSFKFCRPVQTIKLTRAEYAEKLGISVEQIDKVKIVD